LFAIFGMVLTDQFKYKSTSTSMFLLVIIICFLVRPLLAENKVFEVKGVQVDITSENAALARKKALVQGEFRAFNLLLKRLTLSSDRIYFPKISPTLIENYIRDFEVVEEKTSPVRYLAKINFRFKGDLVRKLLEDLSLSFAEARSEPVLIVPVFQTAALKVFWDDPNPWREAWQEMDGRHGLVPLIHPLGDLSDMRVISADQVLKGNREKLYELGKKYKTSKIAIVYGVLEKKLHNKKFKLFLSLYDENNEIQRDKIEILIKDNEPHNVFLKRAVELGTDIINDKWKLKNLLDLKDSNVASFTIPIASLGDWLLIEERLNNIFLISGFDIVLMALDEVRISVNYVGKVEQLNRALTQAELRLINEDGELVLYLLEIAPN